MPASEVLQPALKGSYAVGGLVTLGWEDMRAFVAAAEAENCSVILQAGPGCREHTPLPILGKMFRYLAENASVPVVAHLDHGYTYDECALALDSGFTSLMYDGSRKSLKVNIEETKRIVKMAHSSDISCEGKIGFVGYSNGEKSAGTDPTEAETFANETGVDAMAISVGNHDKVVPPLSCPCGHFNMLAIVGQHLDSCQLNKHDQGMHIAVEQHVAPPT